MLYHLYELQHSALAPARLLAEHGRALLDHPFNPLGSTPPARFASAALHMFEHTTRRYGKPAFDIDHTVIDGARVAVAEHVAARKTFGDLKHFRRDVVRDDPPVLLVAPMSGHYATLLRGTVRALLPDHEVYVTDWRDAREVALYEGGFDLDDYIDYLIDFLCVLGPGAHVVAVCQPSVPVLAAVALMAAAGHWAMPASMVLMGGPIDSRANPTEVNTLVEALPLAWFDRNVITRVPWPNRGVMRRVYPGFLQLAGFMSLNLDRHIDAHKDIFRHLVAGDDEGAQAKQAFYEEYRAVMDMTAEFYLQTVELVFKEHALARGRMVSRGRKVDPAAITDTALMTVEGELDDISKPGQTRAAHLLCPNIPPAMQAHYEQ
ncbi:MAG TPA: polyhydroxyalkanoate depolymerase, partial [Alphaproteobacteria bacterium]